MASCFHIWNLFCAQVDDSAKFELQQIHCRFSKGRWSFKSKLVFETFFGTFHFWHWRNLWRRIELRTIFWFLLFVSFWLTWNVLMYCENEMCYCTWCIMLHLNDILHRKLSLWRIKKSKLWQHSIKNEHHWIIIYVTWPCLITRNLIWYWFSFFFCFLPKRYEKKNWKQQNWKKWNCIK